MEAVLCLRLPPELVHLVVQHGAAMALQGCVRRHRARRVVRGERTRMRAEGERKAAACVLAFLGSFALGKEPLSGAPACWEGDRTLVGPV